MKKVICVIDGQGGNIGATLIKYIKTAFENETEIIALGTNAIATSQMLRAGAHKGASGDDAVCRTVMKADCIVAPVSITWANAMLGEVTSRLAEAVMDSPALKVLLPLTQENVEIVGVVNEPLPHLVQMAVAGKMREVLRPEENARKVLREYIPERKRA